MQCTVKGKLGPRWSGLAIYGGGRLLACLSEYPGLSEAMRAWTGGRASKLVMDYCIQTGRGVRSHLYIRLRTVRL